MLSFDKFQALVTSLEKKIDETEKKFEETSRVSEERLKQALEAESKIVELKTAMHRLLSWLSYICERGKDFMIGF